MILRIASIYASRWSSRYAIYVEEIIYVPIFLLLMTFIIILFG